MMASVPWWIDIIDYGCMDIALFLSVTQKQRKSIKAKTGVPNLKIDLTVP
jgi:hypothetical protein